MPNRNAPRRSAADCAMKLFDTLVEHPQGASTAQLIEWTGLSASQVEKGKARLHRADDDGIFILQPKGKDSIYKLTEDMAESRTYQIWLDRRAFRALQTALALTLQSERTAVRMGRASAGRLYARKAAQMDSLAAMKASLRETGTDAGFAPEEIEAWFAEYERWELNGAA